MRLTTAVLFSALLFSCEKAPSPSSETMPAELPEHSEKSSAVTTEDLLWLEEVEGERAIAWVRAQNERSLNELQAAPEYPATEAAAIEILTSKERIPYGRIRDGMVYNFWQDDTHVRGLWRRTPEAEYAAENPEWETVLDFDKLASDEDSNWVFKGASVFRKSDSDPFVCLISLSDGGKDAVINREFDLQKKAFLDDGFITSEAKQDIAWIDTDTLLIGTDWGDDTVTESGYPFVLKRWKRGTPLADAEEVIRGDKTDVSMWPMTFELEDGRVLACAREANTFFTSTLWLLPEDGTDPVQWPLPPKCSPEGIFKGQFLVALEQDWSPDGQSADFKSGDLVAFELDTFLENHTLPEVSLVFRPDKTQAVNGVAIAKGAALLSINENVAGKVLRLEPGSPWTTTEIKLPGTGQVGVAFADKDEETVFLNYEAFLTPDSLLSYDTKTGDTKTLKSLPGKFDTTDLKVEQFFATSTDGTQIPYLLVCRDDITLDGTTPTLLYAYGGFQISLRPSYNPVIGRLWLEKGGAYVLANIRGGGEYGPNWHQAGLKTKRQIIYDDFIAVGENLIEKKITSPAHLGIMGGSNGGLLMGVMLNQRPDLWNAVVVQVPLLDMLRFHLLLAGASWVDEYGSPEVPEERAFLEKISPVHNFDSAKEYPVPFFVTSTKDDRVHPGHARKMAKKFEDAELPFYYYENTDGGHSAAANQTERAKRSALEFTYLKQRLFGGK